MRLDVLHLLLPKFPANPRKDPPLPTQCCSLDRPEFS